MPSAASYLRVWVLATAIIVGAAAAINLVVDPYALFRLVDISGLNRIKSQASERGPLFKQNAVAHMNPSGLILGNSRAEIGFDPESVAWPAWARPVFNLALPGAGIAAVAGDLDKALHYADPRLVVVGLDFLDFRADPSSDDRFVLPAASADTFTDMRERASALLTLSALLDSIATVKAQHEAYPTGLTAAGFNPKRDYVGIARREGYFALFRQRDQENAGAYLRGPKGVFQSHGRPAASFDALDGIITLARERGIALRFVIYPYHAHTLLLFELTGLWPAYEDWKRELTKRIDAARGSMDIELWDFTGFSPYSDETIPQRGDTSTELQWYWEAGHFKKPLGDLLLAEMLGTRGEAPHWGCQLTQPNLEEHLRRQREARDEYKRTHSDDAADLAALVEAARR